MDLSFQHYLLGLFAVANNIPAIPVYLALCGDLPRSQQKKLCLVASLASFVTMLAAMFVGSAVLSFFEISIHAFRIAGGILLLITGINMVNSRESMATEVQPLSVSQMISVAVIPIAIPLTTGAGTISTVILFAQKLPTYWLAADLLWAIVCMTLVNYLLFRYSSVVVDVLGHTGMNVLTKVFGLITLALGVQFMLTGFSAAFPGLMR